VTTFSESQNRHKWSHLWPSQCDQFCNIKAGRHKKSEKELAKTRLLKLSKTSRIVTAFNRHKTETQMVTIVTVTMRYLGTVGSVFWKIERVLAKIYIKIDTYACEFHTQTCHFHTFACRFDMQFITVYTMIFILIRGIVWDMERRQFWCLA
jgi:hypothetical protein